jgi:hypothetical protein
LTKNDLYDSLEAYLKSNDSNYISTSKAHSPLSMMKKHSSADILLEFFKSKKNQSHGWIEEIVD